MQTITPKLCSLKQQSSCPVSVDQEFRNGWLRVSQRVVGKMSARAGVTRTGGSTSKLSHVVVIGLCSSLGAERWSQGLTTRGPQMLPEGPFDRAPDFP